MAKSIKISDNEMMFLREESALSSRSVAGQAEHWLRIGRAIEKAPTFSYQHVRNALAGLTNPDELTGEEQEVFIDRFADSMWDKATPEQEVAFAQALGDGTLVGVNDTGKLVYHKRGKSE